MPGMTPVNGQFPRIYYNSLDLKANQDRVILDLRAFMMLASSFADLQVAFSVKSVPSLCDAYLIVHEHGGVTPKFWKQRLQNADHHMFDSHPLAMFDPGKTTISVAVDRDITCYVGVTLKDLPAAVVASSANVVSGNVSTIPCNPNIPSSVSYGYIANANFSALPVSAYEVKEEASEPAKQEPECVCRSLLWGHEAGCHLARKR